MAKALGGYRPLNGHRYPQPDQPQLKRLRISEQCWRTAPNTQSRSVGNVFLLPPLILDAP